MSASSFFSHEFGRKRLMELSTLETLDLRIPNNDPIIVT